MVGPDATGGGIVLKWLVTDAIEQLFGVKVTSVNTLIQRGKYRRMGRGHGKLPNWKKAIVTLEAGAKIAFFEEAAEGTE